ncbi:hypothetical protein BDZ88DRAFT_401813 [Geranomyces variabilis]|nr:hypothetical protein BDZ88DRAFT_401813 [Geranomyces variabilis]
MAERLRGVGKRYPNEKKGYDHAKRTENRERKGRLSSEGVWEKRATVHVGCRKKDAKSGKHACWCLLTQRPEKLAIASFPPVSPTGATLGSGAGLGAGGAGASTWLTVSCELAIWSFPPVDATATGLSVAAAAAAAGAVGAEAVAAVAAGMGLAVASMVRRRRLARAAQSRMRMVLWWWKTDIVVGVCCGREGKTNAGGEVEEGRARRGGSFENERRGKVP